MGKTKSWTYVSQMWTGSAEKYCDVVSCPDTFSIGDKQVFMVRWFVGTLNADKVMVVENEGVADWGRFFASQSMTDAAGTRRLMVGNIGHPHWMYGPNDIDIPVNVNNDAAKANANEINVNATNAPQWSHMISLPREVSIYPSSGALAFAPARELAAARQGAPFRVADLPVVSAAPPVPM
eukprot:gene30152-32018_t